MHLKTFLFCQEILRTAELYSPFTTTEEDMMTNELVGGLMSNVSFIHSSNSFDGLNSSTV